MIQFTRPSAGTHIHQFASASGSLPAIQLHGLQTKAKSLGFRPLQTGGSDKFGNKPCYHLNLKGKVCMLSSLDFVRTKVQYNFKDEACTVPYYINCVKPKTKTWTFSHLVRQGENIVFSNTTFYKYRWSYYIYQTIRRITTTEITWLSPSRFRYECWYEEHNLSTNEQSGYAYVYYMEYDLVLNRYRYTFSNPRFLGSKRPMIESWIAPTSYWSSLSSSVYVVTNLETAPIPNLEDFLQRLTHWRRDAMAKESFFFGQCTTRSAQALRVVKTNMFSYLLEASWVFSPINSFRSLVKDILSSSTKKQISKLILGYQYGVKLTVLDTLELLKKPRSSVGFDPMSWTSSRSQMSDKTKSSIFNTEVDVTHTYYQKLYCQRHPSAMIDAWARLMSVGAYPFLETAWDLIPFSFVIDWFTQINEVFEAIDSNTILHSYAILSCISTRRSSTTVPFSVIFPELQGIALGDLEIVDYHRTVSKTPPPIQLDLTPQSFNHWIEGAALIVQRR